jgi:hypothetical protein
LLKAALNRFDIGGAFVVQYMKGLVVQHFSPTDGHHPEIAYQTAFALNVGLQIAAGVWFARTWVLTRRCDGQSARVETGVRRISMSNLISGAESLRA